jgi:serine carboxypeptidase-like clade 1
MYSGYFNVTNGNGKQIHYVFVESQNNPTQDPVLLWLNGGPGCSSMEGLFYENGPFVFGEGSSVLQANNNSWNLNASVLYLESPAGIGLSFLGDVSNNNTNDTQTAADNLDVLVQFFDAYSTLSSLPFYIAGESYAGIYVPTLVSNILQWNSNATKPINLQGYLLGNAVTDWRYDVSSAVPYFAYWHSLINQTLYNAWEGQSCDAYNKTPSCAEVYSQIDQAMNNTNAYDIYRPCDYNPDNTTVTRNLGAPTPWLDCNDDSGIYAYMNNPEVREALHCDNVTWEWELCHHLNYTKDQRGSIYLYPEMLTHGLRVWYFSGDTDSVVATYGTQTWINNLNLTVSEPWRKWYFNSQVAGFTKDYQEGLKFLTIKGTGHMAIQWKKAIGAFMFQEFLQGGKLS